ncbi:DUF4105 domain-containing protein [Bacteroidales bacterium OttesenSCG-928-C19]|nr:DUF4105 domain-containing protein [Bacteroidales bacterium OttesenSCG-928-C19]
MKKILSILSFLIIFNTISANNLPEISLLTCSSGEELYASFGHSGLRVQYPDGEDIVYNFGMFDFDTPNFYLKFVMGKLKYMLGIQETDEFIEIYKYENRSVFEQKLILTETQTWDILNRLNYLYKPENRYYYYSFLYKNCTTELRDIIFTYAGIDTVFFQEKAGITYRGLLNQYINGWAKFGINLMLGSSLDKEVDKFQMMFLPDYLYNELEKIDSSSNIISKCEILTLAESKGKDSFLQKISSPNVVFLLLLIIFLALTYKKRAFYFTLFIYFLIGIIGLIIVTTSLFSDHTELHWNCNLLWCNPLYLLLAIAGASKWKKVTKVTSVILFASLILVVVLWIFGVQYVELAFVWLAYLLLISLLTLLRKEVKSFRFHW